MEKALKIKLIVSTLLFCVVITVLALALVNKYTPSETMRTLDNYYDVASDEAVVLFENEIYGERALLKEGGIYLSYNTVDSLLNDGFFLDEAEQTLIYTLPEEVIRAEVGQSFYYSNNEVVKLPCPAILSLDGVYYLSLDFTQMVSDMTYEFFENPNLKDYLLHIPFALNLYYQNHPDWPHSNCKLQFLQLPNLKPP